MTDPLGSSQVMPYLFGLSQLGHEISLLSFEKSGRFLEGKTRVEKVLNEHRIHWFPEFYTSKPPVLSTLKDLRRAKKTALKIIQDKQIQYVHCRSYIAALAGSFLQKKTGIPYLFDMRGFWADERVDGRIWSLKNPLFRTIYHYFKRKEKRFLQESHHVISLTRSGKEELLQWNIPGLMNEKITVIPCCTDTEVFKPSTDPTQKNSIRRSMGLSPDQPVICYLGSFGTWYMSAEMLDFFKIMLETYPDAIFLIITRDEPGSILREAGQKGIPSGNLLIHSASRQEVPGWLAASDATLFFIKPVYSKKASSPTKMGESLSMGIPVICNDHIGDCTDILRTGHAGIILDGFTEDDYRKAIAAFPDLIQRPKEAIRQVALDLLDLQTGIRRYQQVYLSYEKTLQ